MNRRNFVGALAGGSIALMVDSSQAAGITARVIGDATKTIASLDRRVYGQNLEFMGRQFKGGIIAAEGSRAPTFGNGFREDVRDALAQLGVTHLRWPGGCFADAYNWRDGIGPDRPGHMNPMWGQAHVRAAFLALGETKTPVVSYLDNLFGTLEFMEYARALGAEPSLTASMEADEPDEAAAWVAFIKEEYGAGSVPVWSVGNEQWNPLEHNGCFMRPGRYVKRYLKWAQAMRRADAKIELVASGGDELGMADWNRTLLAGIGREMDYFSTHIYVPLLFLARDVPDDESTYLTMAASYRYVEASLERLVDSMHGVLGEAIPISFDEWNVLATARNFIAPKTSMREAIGAAGIIHAIHRHAEHVRLADQFALVNAAAPAVVTDRDGLARTPMYHVMRLYSHHSRAHMAEVAVDSPSFGSPKLSRVRAYEDTPYVDASLTVEGGRASLFLINRHPREEIEVAIEVEGVAPGADAALEVVSGPASFRSKNRIGADEKVVTARSEVAMPERIKLPCCSVSVVSVEVRTYPG